MDYVAFLLEYGMQHRRVWGDGVYEARHRIHKTALRVLPIEAMMLRDFRFSQMQAHNGPADGALEFKACTERPLAIYGIAPDDSDCKSALTMVGRCSAQDTAAAAAAATAAMPKQVALWAKVCKERLYAKAKKNPAHGLMRARQTELRLRSYGMDICGIVPNDFGYTCALAMVDHCSRWVAYIPLKDRTAHSVVDGLLEVFYTRGFAAELFSDSAQEFRSVMLQGFLKAMGIRHIVTKYDAAANGL